MSDIREYYDSLRNQLNILSAQRSRLRYYIYIDPEIEFTLQSYQESIPVTIPELLDDDLKENEKLKQNEQKLKEKGSELEGEMKVINKSPERKTSDLLIDTNTKYKSEIKIKESDANGKNRKKRAIRNCGVIRENHFNALKKKGVIDEMKNEENKNKNGEGKIKNIEFIGQNKNKNKNKNKTNYRDHGCRNEWIKVEDIILETRVSDLRTIQIPPKTNESHTSKTSKEIHSKNEGRIQKDVETKERSIECHLSRIPRELEKVEDDMSISEIISLPGVVKGPSDISVPGGIGLMLHPETLGQTHGKNDTDSEDSAFFRRQLTQPCNEFQNIKDLYFNTPEEMENYDNERNEKSINSINEKKGRILSDNLTHMNILSETNNLSILSEPSSVAHGRIQLEKRLKLLEKRIEDKRYMRNMASGYKNKNNDLAAWVEQSDGNASLGLRMNRNLNVRNENELLENKAHHVFSFNRETTAGINLTQLHDCVSLKPVWNPREEDGRNIKEIHKNIKTEKIDGKGTYCQSVKGLTPFMENPISNMYIQKSPKSDLMGSPKSTRTSELLYSSYEAGELTCHSPGLLSDADC